MSRKRFVPLMLVVALMSGCGGSSTGQGAISVALVQRPPVNMLAGGTASVSATVFNDFANAGVTWTCIPAGNCGSFSPPSTTSTLSTIYTAPVLVPTGGIVTITASSVTNSKKSDSASVNIKVQLISVNFSPAPPFTIQPSESVTVGAVVSNDTTNAGVNWSCTPASNCGSFSPVSSGSGASTTYTAPGSAPPGGTVMIVATSITDNTESATAIAVFLGTIPSNAMLNGPYSFFLTSPTGTRGTTSLAGSITLDGNGNVSGGVADIISPGVLDLQDQILSTGANSPPLTSFYAVDSAGRGTMRVKTANGQTLDFSFVLTSALHALLTEIDGNPASGTLDLQQHPSAGFAASQISGGYSFTMAGTARTNSATKTSCGGVFMADGVGSLSNGTLDVNTAGVMSSSSFTGSFSAPDSNGRGTAQLSAGRSLIYYVISPRALRIFEADNVDLMGGSAYAQGDSVIFLGIEYFYQNSGWSSAGLTITAGQFSGPKEEDDNNITGGISDSNAGGSPTNANTGVSVTGSYGVSTAPRTGTLNLMDAAGSSTFNLYVVDRSVDILDPNNSDPDLFNGGGNALLLHTDANINGTGILIYKPRAAFPIFLADQALQLTNSVTTSTATNELDLVGVIPSDGSAHFVNGLADYDQNNSSSPVPVLGASVTGTFVADTNNPGRFTGTFTIPTPASAAAYPFISSSATTFHLSYYQIDESKTFIMQTDSSANISGHLIRQLFP